MPPAPIALLPDSDGETIRLRLNDPACFFTAPPVDPLSGHHLALSGFDIILQELKERDTSDTRLQNVELQIPADRVTPETQSHLAASLAAYITARISVEQGAITVIEKELRRAWPAGFLFLVICVALAALLDQMAWLGDFLRDLLSNTIIIAGWVGLWRPLELTLYDRWAPRFRKKTLTHFASLQLIVTAVQP